MGEFGLPVQLHFRRFGCPRVSRPTTSHSMQAGELGRRPWSASFATITCTFPRSSKP